ncbi:MAG: hypothetical protein ACI8WB_002005 [Phenylobacterium sp.]|jgi:hypothetical protein
MLTEDFTTDDRLVELPSSSNSVLDPEYDHYHKPRRLVMVDVSLGNSVIVVSVNDDGQLADDGVSIDSGLSVSGFVNGPEWGNHNGATWRLPCLSH